MHLEYILFKFQGVWSLLYSQNQIFTVHAVFQGVRLLNGEIITYMTFQKSLMTGYRDMGKTHQKCPQNEGFPHLGPQRFFAKITFVPLQCPKFIKYFRKTNGHSLRL